MLNNLLGGQDLEVIFLLDLLVADPGRPSLVTKADADVHAWNDNRRRSLRAKRVRAPDMPSSRQLRLQEPLHSKLGLPQAARPSIFLWKINNVAPTHGTSFRDTQLRKNEKT